MKRIKRTLLLALKVWFVIWIGLVSAVVPIWFVIELMSGPLETWIVVSMAIFWIVVYVVLLDEYT